MEDEESAAAAARLEAALERIAERAQARLSAMSVPAVVPDAVDTSAVAARLDGLIAQLRGALEEQ